MTRTDPRGPARGTAKRDASPLSRLQGDLAQRIIDQIERDQLPVGHRFTELGLAARFDVSRSPVRAALRFLATKGVLRFEPQRGYFLARPADEIAARAARLPRSVEEELYLRIARDRVARKTPDAFSEADFMRRYGCARSLLSRVLTRMSEEGLVRRSRGHGWSFLPLLDSEDAVNESYRLRLLVEPAGLLEPTFRLDGDRLARSRAAHEAVIARGGDIPQTEMFEINAAFHELLASMSGNRFFRQIVQQQNRLRRLNEYNAYHDRARILQSCSEHIAVIDALLAGERFWAANLLREHLMGANAYKGAPGVDSTPMAEPGDRPLEDEAGVAAQASGHRPSARAG